jgi:glycerol-3-phosphate dehydrogenase
VLKVEGGDGQAPLLNIFGGKLTTYRRLAESALEKIGDAIGEKGECWTARSRLPGGDFAVDGFDAEVKGLVAQFPFLAPAHARRLVRLYGTRAKAMLEGAKTVDDLGRHFGSDLYEREVRWLMKEEWARHAEDVLWRRTKRGLHLTAAEAAALEDYMAAARAAPH